MNLARMCENFHCLPGPGGLFDQDSYLMYLFEAIAAADSEKQTIEDKKQDAELKKVRAEAAVAETKARR